MQPSAPPLRDVATRPDMVRGNCCAAGPEVLVLSTSGGEQGWPDTPTRVCIEVSVRNERAKALISAGVRAADRTALGDLAGLLSRVRIDRGCP